MKGTIILYMLAILVAAGGTCILKNRKHDLSLTHYQNIYLVVVKINNNEQRLSNDKFSIPQSCNNVLLKTVSLTDTVFTQLSNCDRFPLIVDIAWFYNHNIGDTVHFEYISKQRFFKIKNNR